MLVVEDDRMVAAALRALLERRGWSVQVTDTAAGALDRLAQDPPACIVLDIMLADGDGTRVLRAVRERDLPSRVIVTTAVSETDRLETIHALEPDALLRKPVSFRSLVKYLGDTAS